MKPLNKTEQIAHLKEGNGSIAIQLHCRRSCAVEAKEEEQMVHSI